MKTNKTRKDQQAIKAIIAQDEAIMRKIPECLQGSMPRGRMIPMSLSKAELIDSFCQTTYAAAAYATSLRLGGRSLDEFSPTGEYFTEMRKRLAKFTKRQLIMSCWNQSEERLFRQYHRKADKVTDHRLSSEQATVAPYKVYQLKSDREIEICAKDCKVRQFDLKAHRKALKAKKAAVKHKEPLTLAEYASSLLSFTAYTKAAKDAVAAIEER